MKVQFTLIPLLITLLVACSSTQNLERGNHKTELGQPGMVVTANPHATKAGVEVLRAGGSAVDAAIAIEAVLSLVEPQSSGLGGGGFMVYFKNKTNAVTIYDGRETAPASASSDLFLNEQGEAIGFIAAKTSGFATGVPGMVSMLVLAHQDHGKIAWGDHFSAAKQLASNGFAISPRLHGLISRFGKYIPNKLEQGPLDAYHYFFDDRGVPYPVGHILKNPAYAKSLELIAADPKAFYQGEIAEQIIAQVTQTPRAGGMTKQDIAGYSARRREALCLPYRAVLLCGPPPPSSWVTVAMTMGILENTEKFSQQGVADPKNWTRFAEAQRLAYADRDRYIADTDMVDVPIKGMLSQDYLSQRAQLVDLKSARKTVEAGDPWAFEDPLKKVAGIDASLDIAGTTHFVVVDSDGDVVSMTASVESIFGSTRMAGGMFLNNQLTDFSFMPLDSQGVKIANAVDAMKRPRSSMSPTIVLDKDGEFKLATGSPGGSSIIAYTAKTLVGILDWGLDPQAAVNLPNIVARDDIVRIEKERASDQLIKGLRDYGYAVKESAGENSGLSVVLRDENGKLQGGVDPRREGVIERVH